MSYKDVQGIHWAYEYSCKLAGNNIIHVEDRLYFEPEGVDLPEELTPIFGHCDGWFFDPNGNLHVIDLKRGSPKKNHFYQMAGYAYALMDKHFEERVQMHVLYFTMKRAITQSMTIEEALDIISYCLNNKLDPNSERTPNEFCKYCKHFLECEAVRERVAESIYLDRFKQGDPDAIEAEDIHFVASLKSDLAEKAKEIVKQKHESGERVKGVSVIEQSRKGKVRKDAGVRALMDLGARPANLIDVMDFDRDAFVDLYRNLSDGDEPPETLFEEPKVFKKVNRAKGYSPIKEYKKRKS